MLADIPPASVPLMVWSSTTRSDWARGLDVHDIRLRDQAALHALLLALAGWWTLPPGGVSGWDGPWDYAQTWILERRRVPPHIAQFAVDILPQ